MDNISACITSAERKMEMREILFRAKRIDNGKWAEGYLVKGKWYLNEEEKYAILSTDLCFYPHCEINEWIEIDPETLCQYTGLTDKNGNRIWENDIIKHEISDTIGTVKWYQEDYVGWCVDDTIIDEQQFTDEMWNECEVIGNIFDNPELLKGE